MGEYVSIRIGGYDFLSCKNTFGGLLLPFSMDDLRVYTEVEDGYEREIRRFSTTVRRAAKVLDCAGFTVKRARELFELDWEKKLDLAEYMAEEMDDHKAVRELSEQYDFDRWASAAKKYALILSRDRYDWEENEYPALKKERGRAETAAERIVLDSLPFGDSFFGLDDGTVDEWSAFRVLLDAFAPDTELFLDYTNLYEGGWCGEVPEEEDFDFPKTVILTEGRFDTQVLSETMGLLYPHLKKLYSFMDFSEFSVQGSAGFLTHYLKAFMAVGAQRRIIAVYDNDSAGLAELMGLAGLAIPENFRVMHLPDTNLCRDYPTVGPGGERRMDINGAASSIELFLGRDVLTENGELTPVQWKGLVDRTQTYQGEIISKSQIQKKFWEKLRRAKSGEDAGDWTEMRILLNAIFDAFL